MKQTIIISTLILLLAIPVFSQIDAEKIRSKLWDYRTTRQHDEAIKLLNDVISENPNEVRWYNWRAEFLFKQKKYEEALIDIDKAIQLEPTNPNHHFLRADYFAVKGEKEKWFNEFETAISKEPNSIYIRQRVAKMYHKSGFFEKVLKVFDYYVAENETFPDNFEIYKIRFENKYELKNYVGALEDAISAIETIPFDSKDEKERRSARLKLNSLIDFKEIDTILSTHLKDDKKVFDYYFRLINLYEKKAKDVLDNPSPMPLQKHKGKLNHMGARQGSTAVLYNANYLLINLAKLYESKGEFSKAEELLERVVQNSPRWYNHSYRASLFEEKKEYEKAIIDLTFSINLSKYSEEWTAENLSLPVKPFNFEDWKSIQFERRGNLYVLTKQFDKAIKDYEEAIKLNKLIKSNIVKRMPKVKDLKKQSDKANKSYEKMIIYNKNITLRLEEKIANAKAELDKS